MQGARKVVLVTGGAQRVGASIARLLHERGLFIVIHYGQSQDQALALKADLECKRSDSVAVVGADLLNPGTPEVLVEAAVGTFGRLDMVVNNASSFYPTPVDSASLTDWEDLMGTNLKAPFFLAKAARAELARAQGAIVNIVDIHSERPLKGYPIYSAAKAGLAMMTKALAREFAPDVRVNGVSPGTILWPAQGDLTEAQKNEIVDRVPLKRSGTPADIASAVAYLLLDASYVSGQILAVDGGRAVVL